MTQGYGNFLVTGTQRTGSSALAEAVATHPQIACGWEWTENCGYRDRFRIAEAGLRGEFDDLGDKDRRHMQAHLAGDVRWLGFRRLFGASDKWLLHPRFSLKLFWDRFEAHLRWIRGRPDLRVIHVIRPDHVDWLKSKYVAGSTRQFVGGQYPDVQVTIPLARARARVRSKLWVDTRLASLADSNPYLAIDYQDLAADLSAVAGRAAAFLDCDPAGLALDGTLIRRQSSASTRDYVANYDALVETLADLSPEQAREA